MKTCPNCKAQIEDSAAFCTACGTRFDAAQGAPAPVAPAAPVVDPFDHTAEFDPKDISENKVVAMLTYILSFIGILIALHIGKESPYASFHLRQALKFLVLDALLTICGAVLVWTIVVPIAAAVCSPTFIQSFKGEGLCASAAVKLGW